MYKDRELEELRRIAAEAQAEYVAAEAYNSYMAGKGYEPDLEIVSVPRAAYVILKNKLQRLLTTETKGFSMKM
jgi:hypothetical protein